MALVVLPPARSKKTSTSANVRHCTQAYHPSLHDSSDSVRLPADQSQLHCVSQNPDTRRCVPLPFADSGEIIRDEEIRSSNRYLFDLRDGFSVDALPFGIIPAGSTIPPPRRMCRLGLSTIGVCERVACMHGARLRRTRSCFLTMDLLSQSTATNFSRSEH